ncbi:hypothetical protein BGX27_006850 [Mortierella sp. AM989]|nr:hypothetical protein BGX27_006850 [Mortierella sp. AM989]
MAIFKTSSKTSKSTSTPDVASSTPRSSISANVQPSLKTDQAAAIKHIYSSSSLARSEYKTSAMAYAISRS